LPLDTRLRNDFHFRHILPAQSSIRSFSFSFFWLIKGKCNSISKHAQAQSAPYLSTVQRRGLVCSL